MNQIISPCKPGTHTLFLRVSKFTTIILATDAPTKAPSPLQALLPLKA